MATFNDDPLAMFESERTKARQRNSVTPFRFHLKDGERAHLHLLLDFDSVTKVILPYHEFYNKDSGKYEVSAICASVIGQECEHCVRAKTTGEWKLKPQKLVYMPAFLHKVEKQDAGKWVPVTYKDEGVEKPITGVRMLEMKLSSSPILDDFSELYGESSEEPSQRSITRTDLMISRRGSGLDTKYSVRPARSSITLPQNLPTYTPDLVCTEVLAHYPPATPNLAEDTSSDDDATEW